MCANPFHRFGRPVAANLAALAPALAAANACSESCVTQAAKASPGSDSSR